MLVLGFLLAGGMGRPATVEADSIVAGPSPSAVTWSPQLADRFPGCGGHPAYPTAVVEVRDGWPRRVSFDGMWARSHDDQPDNQGTVIALCR